MNSRVRSSSGSKMRMDSKDLLVSDLAYLGFDDDPFLVREREKHLRCYYEINEILVNSEITISQMIQAIVKVLPTAWQFSEVAGACITYSVQKSCTDNFEGSGWHQTSPLTVRGQNVGDITISYSESRPETVGGEGPFMVVERFLLDTVAERLGRAIERRIANEALQQSEESLSVIFDAIPDPAFLWERKTDSNIVLVWANSQAVEFSDKQILTRFGTKLEDLSVGTSKAVELIDFVMQTGIPKREEIKHKLRATGEEKWLLVDYIKTGDNQVLSISKDVTALKVAEEALRQSHEEVYRRTFNAIPSPAYLLKRLSDERVVLEQANQAAHTITDNGVSTLIGKDIGELYSDEPELISMIDEVLKTGETIQDERLYTYRSSGEKRWLDTQIARIGPEEVLVITKDITDRKAAKTSLQESRDAYRAVVEGSLQGFIILQNDQIVFANRVLENIIGYTEDDLVSLPPAGFVNLIHPEDRGIILERLRVRMAGGSVVARYPVRVLRKDGSIRWIEVFNNVIEYQGAQALQSTIIDVTELKQKEMELRERIKELNCLYGIAKIVEKPNITLPEIFQGVVELIPSAWKYPEIAGGKITYLKDNYVTSNYIESPWVQKAKIFIEGSQVGEISVSYTEKRDPGNNGEGPFLKEERLLIDAVAERLGRIIERYTTEEELKRSEAKYEDLYHSAPVAYLSININGIINDANSAAEEFLGYSIDELRGMKVFDLYTNESLKKAKTIFNQFRTGIPIENEEINYKRKDGEIVHGLLSVSAITDESGKVLESRSVIVDITERKKLSDLHRRLAMEQVRLSFFKVGSQGPEVKVTETVPFYQGSDADLFIKIGIYYAAALGQGNGANLGLFGPLPLPDAPDYVGFAYSFFIKDPFNTDPRCKGESYAFIVFSMHNDFVSLFSDRESITKTIKASLRDVTQISDIDLQFLEILKRSVLNMESS